MTRAELADLERRVARMEADAATKQRVARDAPIVAKARQMQEDSEQGIETYLAVTLIYFVCAFTANRGMAWIEARSRVPGLIAKPG